MMFSRQMYTITKAGVPLLRGLKGLQSSMHNAVLRDALADVVWRVSRPAAISARASRVIPRSSRPCTSTWCVSARATGTLDTAFLRLSDYLNMEQDVHDRVQSALRYPDVRHRRGDPRHRHHFRQGHSRRSRPCSRMLGNNIPLPTRIIMGISSRDAALLVAHAAGAARRAFSLIRAYLATDARALSQMAPRQAEAPLVGNLIHEAILARVTRSLAICLSAGIPGAAGARHDRAHHRQRLRQRGHAAPARHGGARRLHQPRGGSGDLFPPLVIQMIAVGEETGELPSLLGEVAEHYRRDVDYQLKNLSAVIEPVLIVAVGGVVLVLALGVFLPMWDMYAKVGGH
jgi:MSHA biogenesis protein MshG